jgi:hypothetical protein
MCGLGAALVVLPRIVRPPAPGQLPGFASVNGFDPRSEVWRLVVLLALPIVGGAVAARLRTLARSPDRVGAGLLAAAAAAHALVTWRLMLPYWGAANLATLGLYAGLAALAVGLAAALGAGDPRTGAIYLSVAAAVFPLALLTNRPRRLSLALAAGAFLLPVLARILAVRIAGMRRFLRALTVAVLLPGSVTVLAGAAVMQLPRIADLFEDGHQLLPASEYLRGERPYRDIVPGHGLVSDGLLAAAQLRIFGDDYRGLFRGEKAAGATFWPAFYAVGWAATGSAAFGFGGALFSFLFFPQYMMIRPILSLVTLALALFASRSKRPAAWTACGAAIPLGLCVAVEYTAYAAAAAAVALVISRGDRRSNLRRFAMGLGISAAVVAAGLGAAGILGSFLKTTFLFIPSLYPVYAQGFPPLFPGGLPLWSGVLADDTAILYAFVGAAVVLLGGRLALAPAVGSRARGALPVLAWAVAAMLSVAERRHVGYPFLVVPIGGLLLARWFSGRRPWGSPRPLASATVLAVLAMARKPVVFALILADAIVHPPGPTPEFRTFDEPPRARGALFRRPDAALVEATAEMMRRADFRPGDTWLDFVGLPGLYFLFDRDCPIRYYEVAFFESEAAQDEVIAAVEKNPRVRAVLMHVPFGDVDTLGGGVRAPRVDAYLRERFRPFSRDGEIEWWVRKDAGDHRETRPGPSPSSPP